MKLIKKALPYILALCLILVIGALDLFHPNKNEVINVGLFIATVVLTLIGYIQLKALRDQANADFLFKFNRDFYTNKVIGEIIASIEGKKNLFIKNNGKFFIERT